MLELHMRWREEIDMYKVKPNFKRMRNTNRRKMNMKNKRRKTRSIKKKKKIIYNKFLIFYKIN